MFSKSMLDICKNLSVIKVGQDVAVNDVLHYFTRDGSEADRSIIAGFVVFTWFENRSNQGMTPVIGNSRLF